MRILVIFDIPSDKIRYKIGETCKDYGLQRIQKSSFLGNINHNRNEELRIKLKKVLGNKPGNIQMFPLCKKDFIMRKLIINEEESIDGS